MSREFDRLVCRVVRRVRDDFDAATVRFLDDDLDDALALFLGERPELAHDPVQKTPSISRSATRFMLLLKPASSTSKSGVNGVVIAVQIPWNCAFAASFASDLR